MKIKKNNNEVEILKNKLSEFDLVAPGTLRNIYSKCGKINCACQTDEKARHGPYWLWDRKVNGKLSSKMISKSMALQIKKWIKNRNGLEDLVKNIIIQSEKIITELAEDSRK